MTEEAMVELLLEVSGGNVCDERDIVLARAAARWAHEVAGWTAHPEGGFTFRRNGLHYWVLADSPTALEIRVGPGQMIWHRHLRAMIGDVGHGLDVLAAERLIPGQFSTLGLQTLQDWAETLDRSASRLTRLADQAGPGRDVDSWELRIRAATLNRAADQARAFPRGKLAVVT